jgi:O-antigen biosynthesis protein
VLHHLRVWVVETARRTLPINSRSRGIAIASFHSYKAARHFLAETRSNFQNVPLAKASGESYAAFLREERSSAAAAPNDAVDTTFAVVIEVRPELDPVGVARTRRSLAAQKGPKPRILEVPSGTPFAEVLPRIAEDFVVFLAPGDVLQPDALLDIAKQHRVDPGLRVIAFDSDLRSPAGGRISPRFRPIWSPEMLLGANYLGRAFAARTGTLAAVGDFDVSARGLWRFLLRAQLPGRAVGNVSRVLLTEAHAAGPATHADSAMVRETLRENGEQAHVDVRGGVTRVLLVPEQWPSVSIVIPTRHSRANLARLLPSLATTDYPEFDVKIMDNGGQSEDNEEWYRQNRGDLNLDVQWWTESPFNYSRVNNVGARSTTGEVVLFLNDDTEIVDPLWLQEMVGLLMRPGVGTVGVQHRQGEGLIQHGGVTIGPNGFADNLFAGLRPGDDTLLGPTSWYRNSLAVTGACVAIRREHFEQVNGLDERFVLMGSDVVLGLDQIIRGRRNVVVPFDTVRHYESITRGSAIPMEDFYASYWRYHPWLQNGDPYSSPNVSRLSAVPKIANSREVRPVQLALAVLGRAFTKVTQSSSISDEAKSLLGTASVTEADVQRVHAGHAAFTGFRDVQTINWFIPDVDMPFFGGLNTAFRIADKLTRDHGIRHRFIAFAQPNEAYISSAIAAAFPALAGSEVLFYDGSQEQIDAVPQADAVIATLWLTAMHVAKSDCAPRKFYLMQDFEPGFYPASSMYAMAEESYRLGLYGLCNTESMHRIYSGMYGGRSTYFTPAVDQGIYNAVGRRTKAEDEPVTIFAYARDHFRNCWELVYAALSEVKRRHGDRVRIVAAGARYLPESADFIDMGLLDYRATGDVYRETDIGLTMQISRHPSYLPLELMSSGVAMVAPDSDWFTWLFDDEKNSVLTMRTLDDIVASLDRLIVDKELRARISAGALESIRERHSDWDAALDGVYAFLTDPEAVIQSEAAADWGTAEGEATEREHATRAPAAP